MVRLGLDLLLLTSFETSATSRTTGRSSSEAFDWFAAVVDGEGECEVFVPWVVVEDRELVDLSCSPDGLANRGVTDPDAPVEMAKSAGDDGVGTSTIGIGESFDEETPWARLDGPAQIADVIC